MTGLRDVELRLDGAAVPAGLGLRDGAGPGSCMGGGSALLLGARVPERVEELEGLRPVVAGYGSRDRLLPDAERLLRPIAVAGHDADAAEGRWPRIRAYLATQLRGVPGDG